MIKVEFDNGDVIEFSDLKEAAKYERDNNTKYVRIVQSK